MNQPNGTDSPNGMHEPTEQARLMHVDRLIDDVLRQRAAGPIRPASASLPADQALVTELSALTLLDWPADEAGERIARGVALQVGPAQQQSPDRPRRIAGARTWVAVAVGAAAAVLLTVSVLPGGSPSGTVRPGTAPAASHQSMRLVDATSFPFRSVGSGPSSFELTCVTGQVCYAQGQPGQAVQRTSDGGVTWRPVAEPGAHLRLIVSGLSCPTTRICAGLAESWRARSQLSGTLHLAVTRDGGARWHIESLPAPPGSTGAVIDQVSCGTALACVVHLTDHGPGAFLSTADGGKSWTAASVVPAGAPRFLWYLHCQSDGRCIGLAPTGTTASGGITSIRSADHGRSWTVATSVRLPQTEIFLVSCGDALHCMSVAGDGQIATTSDGGAIWRTSAAPVPSSDTITSVSCATGLDCVIAASNMASIDGNADLQTYQRAVIEATSDQGATWTPVSLPTVGGARLAIVFPLSCPSQAGCIAAAASDRQNGDRREIISSFPAAG